MMQKSFLQCLTETRSEPLSDIQVVAFRETVNDLQRKAPL